MSPAAQNLSRYREPFNEDGGYDSDSSPEQDFHRFPSKHVDDNDEGARFPLNVERQQHYADSEPKSRLTGRSRTSSSARRSRKTSSSTARDLVRVLLHERLEADATADVQLARAYEVLRAESRRAADAERIALESAERLKGLAISRSVAQNDAMRAQAELAAYRLQLENAQRQLVEANEIAAASDAERVRAEQSMGRLKRTVEKLRGGELERRAREQGWREGRREALGGLAGQMRSSPREPIYEEDDDEILYTPTSNVPIPVPPPESIAVMSRRSATPTLRRSTRTPVPHQPDWHSGPVPNIRRQATPPSWRAPTPSYQLPVPPPASLPILSRRSETPTPRHTAPVYDDFDPVSTLDPRDRQPDHIIVRSPVPKRGPFQPPPVARPASSQATRPTHITYPHQQPPDARRGRTRHFSVDDPATLASASADRIYSHYATSSESSGSEPPRPPSRSMRSRHELPEQETIVPRPARRHDGRFSPPVRPPSAFDSVPLSAASLARQRRLERRISHSSSSATSSPQTEKSFPAPSCVAQLARQSLGERKWSAESGSSVPGIFIEPPSRPESADSAGTAHPSHISPFGQPEPELADDIPSPAWGMQPQPLPRQHSAQATPHVPRPASRTGFMYGPPSPASAVHPPSMGMGMGMGMGFGADGTGVSAGDGMGFATPPSPGRNFGAPPPSMPMPPAPHRSAPRHMHVSGMPTEIPGSVNDYFGGDHHRNTQGSGHGRRQGHRREPAAMAASVESLGSGVVDPNAFHDPDTDPSLQDEEDEFGGGRAPTPRVSAGAYAFDDGRAGFDERRGGVHGSERGSLGRRSGTPGPAFVPPRPSSRASAPYDEFGPAGGSGFDSPQRVPLPPSGPAVYAPRAGSVGPAGSGGRSRKTSFLNGGTNGRRVEVGGSRPASRTAFGNTPYVRSSGLYEG